MKQRIGILLLLFLGFALAPQAQQRRKPAAKKTVVTKKTNKSNKNSRAGQASKSAKRPTTVQALEKQRKQIQQQIKEQERRLANTQQDVKKRLQNLMMLNTEIAGKRRTSIPSVTTSTTWMRKLNS